MNVERGQTLLGVFGRLVPCHVYVVENVLSPEGREHRLKLLESEPQRLVCQLFGGNGKVLDAIAKSTVSFRQGCVNWAERRS